MTTTTRLAFSKAAFAVATLVLALLALAGCGPEVHTVSTQSSEKPTFAVTDTASSSSAAASLPALDVTSGSSSTSSSSTSSASSSASSASLPAASAPSAQLTQAVSEASAISNASGMDIGISVVDLPTGQREGYLADEQMASASMIKLAIAYAFLEQVAAGTAPSLNDYYTLQPSDIVGGTGVLGALGAGAQVTYGELLDKMISVSDNTGTNILIDEIGMEAVNATARKLGLDATQLNRYMMDTDAIANGIENYTSANDVATLLQMAYEGSFVNPECSEVVMQTLEGQQDYNGILAGLPPDVAFAHKTGALGTVRHDGGIVECEHPYIVVTLCGGDGFYDQGAMNAMAQIGSVTYDALVR